MTTKMLSWKTCILSLSFMLFALQDIPALETVENETTITTTKTWGEITADAQRYLIRYFDGQLTKELQRLGIPSFWNNEAENALLGSQERFNAIVTDTHSQAQTYAANQKITLDDLLPVGFMMGLGVTGSETIIAGMGGSILLTLTVVPTEVTVFDKTTGKSTTTFEASWAIGGIGQGQLGTGVSVGFAVRGALGLIWGHLPDAILLQGTAIGAGGTIAAVAGIGFKVALLFNSSPGVQEEGYAQTTNLIAMATYDMGIEAGVSVEGEVFYFLSQDQVMKLIPQAALTYNGTATIDASQLQ